MDISIYRSAEHAFYHDCRHSVELRNFLDGEFGVFSSTENRTVGIGASANNGVWQSCRVPDICMANMLSVEIEV